MARLNGTIRAYLFGYFLCLVRTSRENDFQDRLANEWQPGFLFGYDTGIVGMNSSSLCTDTRRTHMCYRRCPDFRVLRA